MGGTGEIARASRAICTVGRRSKDRTSRIATAGITTTTATSDRTSRAGLRIRLSRSPIVVFSPKPKTVHRMLTRKARMMRSLRSI
jgi:hypothetical protein